MFPAGRFRSGQMPARGSKLRRIPYAAAGLLALATAALAIGAPNQPTLGASHNAQLGKSIVVDAKGLTVYVLRPETTHHLLCTSKACLQFWPPVTVRAKTKLKAGSGVVGRLGVLRRSNGVLQVTLGGLPLYRFAPDQGVKGHAIGEGIHSFGGTWHVITAKASTKSTSRPAAGATTPANPRPATTPAYSSPGY